MRIVDFLAEENCLANFSSDEKNPVLRELCHLLHQNGQIEDEDAVYEAVINREKLGTTGIGDAVAIPHAKSDVAPSLVAAFGLKTDGMDFHSVDEKPVQLIFLLIASSNATGSHLKALARISRLLKSERFRRMVVTLDTPKDIYDLIAAEDQALG